MLFKGLMLDYGAIHFYFSRIHWEASGRFCFLFGDAGLEHIWRLDKMLFPSKVPSASCVIYPSKGLQKKLLQLRVSKVLFVEYHS